MKQKKELSLFWMVVCWVLTGIVLFIYVLIATIIKEQVSPNSRSNLITCAGFMIGMSCYPLIKECICKLTSKNGKDPIEQNSETFVIKGNEEIYQNWDAALLFTHTLRVRTADHPMWWKTFAHYVLLIIGEEEFDGCADNSSNNRNVSVEYLCADYAKKEFLSDKKWLDEERNKIDGQYESSTFAKQLDKKLKIVEGKADNLEKTSEVEPKFIKLMYKTGARMSWLGMYNYLILKENEDK